GAVDVVVTTPHGSSDLTPLDRFTYLAAAPSVTGLSASSGTTDGGTAVTISGSNFTGATQVLFGSAQAAFSVSDDDTITATSPVQAAGTLHVTVVTPWRPSPAVPADPFTYSAASGIATVTGLRTSSGPTGGGTSVTLTGTNFSGVPRVAFGSLTA